MSFASPPVVFAVYLLRKSSRRIVVVLLIEKLAAEGGFVPDLHVEARVIGIAHR